MQEYRVKRYSQTSEGEPCYTGGAPIFLFDSHVPQFEQQALNQLQDVAMLPFVSHVAAMPDTHLGMGSTIGSVIAMKGAIIPTCVGVDIGCGMSAALTSLTVDDIPPFVRKGLRTSIEKLISCGGLGPQGGWEKLYPRSEDYVPPMIQEAWDLHLGIEFEEIFAGEQKILSSNSRIHLGSLGTGNHFIEICLDEQDRVWVMLHSGSRGVGNCIGRVFIRRARDLMDRYFIRTPNKDLGYFPEYTDDYWQYMKAVSWAQKYAKVNRRLMMQIVLDLLATKPMGEVIDCHHNYTDIEFHNGHNVNVIRKGAVRARKGDVCIIPGSMGAKSYIGEGLGGEKSLDSCSHGAGRAMSRTAAKKAITMERHQEALKGVACNNSSETLDESPDAYKDIDAVMASQTTLVKPLHELRAVVCVKG